MFHPSTGQSPGFTLVELITVIALLGILAAFALPRFFGAGTFAERSAQSELIAAARHAQQLAMLKGTGHAVQLEVQSSRYGIRMDGNWLTRPGTNERYPVDFPNGVSASSLSVNFLTIGDATVAGVNQSAAVTLTGRDEQRRVCIERTGYAHAC